MSDMTPADDAAKRLRENATNGMQPMAADIFTVLDDREKLIALKSAENHAVNEILAPIVDEWNHLEEAPSTCVRRVFDELKRWRCGELSAQPAGQWTTEPPVPGETYWTKAKARIHVGEAVLGCALRSAGHLCIVVKRAEFTWTEFVLNYHGSRWSLPSTPPPKEERKT
jgi:hypothetical protein